jgi:secondary thiamine-phosphate synthase enzyme
MQHITITTDSRRQVIDITGRVTENLPEGSGVAMVFVRHTTAAITTADLDPGTDLDLLEALGGMLPSLEWRHPHNPAHAPDHLLASVVGPSVTVPFEDGKLLLGTWQRIILLEFDGPMERNIVVATYEE